MRAGARSLPSIRSLRKAVTSRRDRASSPTASASGLIRSGKSRVSAHLQGVASSYLCIYPSMYLCMFVCMHVSICLSIYIYRFPYVCMHACIYLSIYLYRFPERASTSQSMRGFRVSGFGFAGCEHLAEHASTSSTSQSMRAPRAPPTRALAHTEYVLTLSLICLNISRICANMSKTMYGLLCPKVYTHTHAHTHARAHTRTHTSELAAQSRKALAALA